MFCKSCVMIWPCFYLTRSQFLKVAFLCPLDEEPGPHSPVSTALENLAGWNLFIDKQIRDDEKTRWVNSDLVNFTSATLDDKITEITTGDTKYDLVVGCNTYMHATVVRKLQAASQPHLMCEGGNPSVWNEFKDASTKWGFTMHAPFTEYPMAYLELAKKKFELSHNNSKPKVMFVKGSSGDFETALCTAAVEAAKTLELELIDDGEMKTTHDMHLEKLEMVDILYACTLGSEGTAVMDELASIPYKKLPHAISITVSPALKGFHALFKKRAAYISYPVQWHHTSTFTCASDCAPAPFRSVAQYNENFSPYPSYQNAGCSAAGVALREAMDGLQESFKEAEATVRQTLIVEQLSKIRQTKVRSFWGNINLNTKNNMDEHEIGIVQLQPRLKGMKDIDLDSDDVKDVNIVHRIVTADTFLLKEEEYVETGGGSSIGTIIAVITLICVAIAAGVLVKWHYFPSAPLMPPTKMSVASQPLASAASEVELSNRK